MEDQLPCHTVFKPGCARMLQAPTWCHEDEWTTDGGRRTGPSLREDLPERHLRILAASPAPDVRVAVLTHPGTPPDLVDRMLDDPTSHVRSTAIRRTTDVTALRLGARGEWYVRVAVASNPNTPGRLLAKLARDRDQQVRVSVVLNPAVPPRLVDKAARSRNDVVRWWALYRTTDRKLMRATATSGDAEDRQWLADNPHLPLDVLTVLAEDPSPRVRGKVAAHPACTPDLRRRIEAGPNPGRDVRSPA
ncbi:variant leucine-rich repeat-containing protein [Streptacidiphilus sp. PAMC 29251]